MSYVVIFSHHFQVVFLSDVVANVFVWLQLLMPLDIELHSSAPYGRNHHAEVVFLSDVIVNVSPAAIRAVTATVSAVPPPKVGDVNNNNHYKNNFCFGAALQCCSVM